MLLLLLYISSNAYRSYKVNKLILNQLNKHPVLVIKEADNLFGLYEINGKEIEITLSIGRDPILSKFQYSKCRPPYNDLGLDIGEERCTRSWQKNGINNVSIYILFKKNGMIVISQIRSYRELIDIEITKEYNYYLSILKYLDRNL